MSIVNNNDTQGSYEAVLFDPSWKRKRKQILQRDQHKCCICGGMNDLQVHHRQYHFVKKFNRFKNPWEYSDNLLITLCQACHQKGHRLYEVPTIYLG